jgi:hypothetical protein
MMSVRGNLSSDKLGPIERGLVAATVFLLIEGAGLLALARSTAIEGIAEQLSSTMPPAVFSFLLDNLLYSAKPLLLIGLIIGVYVASIVLAAIYQAAGIAGISTRSGLVFGATAILVFALDLLVRRPGWTAVEAILAAVAAAAYVSVFALSPRPAPASAPAPAVAPTGLGRTFSRRMLVTGLVGFGGALAVGGYYWSNILAKSAPITARTTSGPGTQAETGTTGDDDPWSKISYLSPEITPTDEFYFVSKNFVDPVVNESEWTLTVEGLVDNPLSFTSDEFKKLPSE